MAAAFLLALALLSAGAHAGANSAKCAALVARFGGRSGVFNIQRDVFQDSETVMQYFRDARDEASMDYAVERLTQYLRTIEEDFNRWHPESGVRAHLVEDPWDWRPSSSLSATRILVPVLRFDLVARPLPSGRFSTKIAELIRARLINSPEVKFQYHPFMLFTHREARGLFSGILTDANQMVSLGIQDIYSFDMLPSTALHELTHLNRRQRLMRWRDRGGHRLHVAAGSVFMNENARRKFKNEYFQHHEFTSVDEGKAALVSALIGYRHVRMLHVDKSTPSAALAAAIDRYAGDHARAVDMNTDFKLLFTELRDSLEQNTGGIEFFYKHVGNVAALVVDHFDRTSRTQTSVVIPFNLDDLHNPDPVVTNFYSSMMDRGAVDDWLPPTLRAEIVAAIDQQITQHTKMLRRLEDMPSSERFFDWEN